jgi:hypothetical protein
MGMGRLKCAQAMESVSIYLTKRTSKSAPTTQMLLATIRGRIRGGEVSGKDSR